jgi:chromosome segregation ATPase
MTATKTPNRIRDLRAKRAMFDAQLAALETEKAEAERSLAAIREQRAAGTATVRDVSVAKLDVDQLGREVSEKTAARDAILQEIADEDAAAERKKAHTSAVRNFVEKSRAGRDAFAEFEKERAQSAEALSRTHEAYLRQIECQHSIAKDLRALESEGVSLAAVLEEVESAGADLRNVNVSFGMRRIRSGPSETLVENGTRPLARLVKTAPIVVEKASEEAGSLIDAALNKLGVPVA